MNVGRGFLTADVPALGITIVATHLKSSRGASPGTADLDNAKKRELVAAAMAKFVADKLASNPASTLLAAGDMDVGETDQTKNGFRLVDDNFNSSAGDLYDDTHAIFSEGLIDGLHMASLTIGLGSETYDDPQFAGSGPIDCLYVAGAQAGDFTLAKMSTETFGSDHFAVSTRFLFSGIAPVPAADTVRIASLLPNPVGQDPGNEVVKLRNVGTDAVNISGWSLRDEANHSVTLAGTIAAGAELTIQLAAGQMPLNNGGDEIELLNAAGAMVHIVGYTAAQVSEGVEISFGP